MIFTISTADSRQDTLSMHLSVVLLYYYCRKQHFLGKLVLHNF